MKNLEYGIHNVTVGNDEKESKVVKFGDGLNRVYEAVWDEDKISGILILRDLRLDLDAFSSTEDGGGDHIDANEIIDTEKVFLLFDNERSIDAVISMLNQAKNNFKKLG